MTPRPRRTYTDDFKNQMVLLYQNGKPRKDILAEYELTASAFDKWVRQSQSSGSFKEKDNRTPEQEEMIRLRKENERLRMENDIFKASGADTRTKIKVIQTNAGKYPVSAMCECLDIARSTYYYESKSSPSDDESLTEEIQEIFRANRRTYGTRRIKKELSKKGKVVSRRKISRIMKKLGLQSCYTVAHYRVHQPKSNESDLGNTLNREFKTANPHGAIVSDLTYVRVGKKWNYLCVLLDLYNREIIGYSCGEHKTAELVLQAFHTVKAPLSSIQLFHTDRGSEFDNQLISKLLDTFDIVRSLSAKGCPYDNAVAEATFKSIKTEFVYQETFETIAELQIKWFDYVHWYNHIRLHSTLDYMAPVEYRRQLAEANCE
ncbi:MAG: IS3 family transposase [Trichococcus flocculiformis]